MIRTGYGIFWLPNDVRWNMAPNNDAVNSFNNPFNGTLDGSVTPLDTLSNPFPNGLAPHARPERESAEDPLSARV